MVPSERDLQALLELLQNPPKPNGKMIDLIGGRHAERKGIHIR